MLKLIWVTFILALLPSMARADADVMCLKHVDMKIRRLYPPMHIVDHLTRKDKIVLRIPVDCKSGKLLVPTSFSQAQDFLDLALPLDFKQGITGGDHLNPYIYTMYGSSVEDDLYDYFTAHWSLSPVSTACKDAPLDSDIDPEGNTCFYQLIDSVRAKYKNPIAVTPR